MASNRQKKEGKHSDTLRHHRSQLCNILVTAEQTMLSFAIKLYEKHVISMETKIDVCKRKGLDGPDTLLNQLETKVDQNPKHLYTILEIMEELEDLQDVLESMQRENDDKKLEAQSSMSPL